MSKNTWKPEFSLLKKSSGLPLKEKISVKPQVLAHFSFYKKSPAQPLKEKLRASKIKPV